MLLIIDSYGVQVFGALELPTNHSGQLIIFNVENVMENVMENVTLSNHIEYILRAFSTFSNKATLTFSKHFPNIFPNKAS